MLVSLSHVTGIFQISGNKRKHHIGGIVDVKNDMLTLGILHLNDVHRDVLFPAQNGIVITCGRDVFTVHVVSKENCRWLRVNIF